jgi:hypothetical protein
MLCDPSAEQHSLQGVAINEERSPKACLVARGAHAAIERFLIINCLYCYSYFALCCGGVLLWQKPKLAEAPAAD